MICHSMRLAVKLVRAGLVADRRVIHGQGRRRGARTWRLGIGLVLFIPG